MQESTKYYKKNGLFLLLENKPYFWSFLIIFFGTVIRLWFISSGQLNLSPDEAQYWDWSRTLQLSYYSKGPLIAWNTGFWTSILGDTEFGVRFGAVFNSCVAQLILLFCIGKLLNRPRLAIFSLIVANTMPLFMASSILMTTDSPLLLCWISAFFALYAVAKNPHHILPYIVLFLAMALGNLAKYMMFAFFAVAILYLYILIKHSLLKKSEGIKILLVMLAGCCVGLIPILLWNAMNDWVGFFHVTTLAGVTGKKATSLLNIQGVPEFLGGQLGIATPWWLILILFTGFKYFVMAWKGKGFEKIQFLHMSKEECIRQTALFSIGFLVLWLGFFIWSFHTVIYANWPAMSFVAGIILAASGFEQLIQGIGRPIYCKLTSVWVYIGIVLMAFLYLQDLNPLPRELDPTTRLRGWNHLSQELEKTLESMPDPDKVFFVSNRYDTTAALSFYGPNQPHAYLANFDNRLSQYDLWEKPDEGEISKIGYDAIFVSTEARVPPIYFELAFAPYFEEVELKFFPSVHRNKAGREFYIGILKNYKGKWPTQEIYSY